jgi:hypothetical protein
MVSDEVPEADAIEQAQPVTDDGDRSSEPHIDDEVPEADAIEQAQTVPVDDDDEPR